MNVQTVQPGRAEPWCAANFEALEQRLNGEFSSVVHGLRRDAMQRFNALGFPDTHDEEWRFTDVSPYVSIPYRPVLEPREPGISKSDLGKMVVRGLPGFRLVFINGHFAPDYSVLPDAGNGLRVGSLASVMSTGIPGATDRPGMPGGLGRLGLNAAGDPLNPFTLLNTAFLQDGLFLKVPAGYAEELPVYMLFYSTQDHEPFCTHPRNLIIAEEGARVSVVEEYFGSGPHPYFTNSVTEIFAGRGAAVEFDRFQHESESAFHVSSVYVRQEAGSSVTMNAVSYGSAMARHNVVSVLDGERAQCTLNGLSLTTGSQHIDNHTTIDHVKPNCASHELYKAILEGSSKGVFNGKIFVRRDAQKTDARQTNKSLLLSDNATIDTKPQLEIFADDVRCTHGATVGQLDEDQVFYLRSRGMGLDDARDLLTNAFASDVLNRIRLEPLREHLQAILHVRLCKGRILAENR
ncbi:MAG TPA: Fe-S cluster assembly protein SufD [Bacteroidota bacterium]|nr:Fe-S cluster assembly protein SufD [Bacteroidota bacterium]